MHNTPSVLLDPHSAQQRGVQIKLQHAKRGVVSVTRWATTGICELRLKTRSCIEEANAKKISITFLAYVPSQWLDHGGGTRPTREILIIASHNDGPRPTDGSDQPLLTKEEDHFLWDGRRSLLEERGGVVLLTNW